MGTRARHHHATTRPEPVTPPHLLDDGPPARAWDEPSWPDPTLLADDVMAAARMVLDRRQAVTGWLMAEEVTQ